jgi:hypothetical protein
MTKTALVEPELTLDELNIAYNRLAYAISQGEEGAAVQLQKIENRIEAVQRAERRKAAAAIEHQRVAVAAERQAQLGARHAEEGAHAANLLCKRAALDQVEQITAELIIAIKAALIAGDEAHSSAVRLGVSPGQLTSSAISTYIHWKLGRDGADTAGLSDMMPTFPAMRVPLVRPPVSN